MTVNEPSVMVPHVSHVLYRARFSTSKGALVTSGVAKRKAKREEKEGDNLIIGF
jgi:hypothetical protein